MKTCLTAALRTLYSLFLLPIVTIDLLRKCLNNQAYRARWPERFGSFKSSKRPIDIWFHAVSLGEVLSVRPLIEAVLTKWPDKSVAVTTMTPTGSQQVIKYFGDRVFHVYLPYDISWIIRRFIKRVNPKLAIFMETELWPNLFQRLFKNNIPLLLVNARLSRASAKGYSKLPWIKNLLFDPVCQLLAQSKQDLERYLSLGFPLAKSSIVGNIKFDLPVPTDLVIKAERLRNFFGIKRIIWICGSTHQGEEEIILQTFISLRNKFPKLLLCLVPRHPERCGYVANLCNKHGLLTVRHSQYNPNDHQLSMLNAETQVYLVDTIGEMLYFYAASDVAFVGGSLVPVGGHNLLEPAVLGLPVITGDYTFNFSLITELLIAQQALMIVSDQQELKAACEQLLANQSLCTTMGQASKRVVANHRGATDKILINIERAMKGAFAN